MDELVENIECGREQQIHADELEHFLTLLPSEGEIDNFEQRFAEGPISDIGHEYSLSEQFVIKIAKNRSVLPKSQILSKIKYLIGH